MSHICPHCGENETTGTHIICDPCYDNAGEFLERNSKLIKALPDLLALARTFKAACVEHIDVLTEEVNSGFSLDLDAAHDRIAHWEVLKEKATAALAIAA